MTTAEVIAIGTELLLGETVDTNTCFIARTLRSMGVDLFRTQTIGDNATRIAAIMQEALARVDFVITTGGLGPTVDDPTREAAALASGQFLEYHADLWEQVQNRISRYGRKPTDNQKRQAYLPQNAKAIENPVGTAPAFIVEIGQKSLICLPGVPREMEELLKNAVCPYLQEHFRLNEFIHIRTLHVSGVGEAILDERIGDLEMLSNPTVGLAAHSGIVSIRIAAKGKTNSDTLKMIDDTETELRSRLGNDIFGVDTDTLEAITLKMVEKRGWTLTCVEFQTEGALQKRLSRISNPAFLGSSALTTCEEPLVVILERYMAKEGASAGLAVSCFKSRNEKQAAIALFTPDNKEERILDYGGHPDNLSRWTVNIALDWLRRSSIEKREHAK